MRLKFGHTSIMAYLFSIRPEYCTRIFDGKKTVELRRRVSPKIPLGSLMLIYETSPTKAVTGSAVISGVTSLPLADLWTIAKAQGGINSEAFDSYFAGMTDGYAIDLCRPRRFEIPVSLSRLVVDYNLQAPQSYREVADSVAAALMGHGQVSLGHEYFDPSRGRSDDTRGLRLAAA